MKLICSQLPNIKIYTNETVFVFEKGVCEIEPKFEKIAIDLATNDSTLRIENDESNKKQEQAAQPAPKKAPTRRK